MGFLAYNKNNIIVISSFKYLNPITENKSIVISYSYGEQLGITAQIICAVKNNFKTNSVITARDLFTTAIKQYHF